MRLKILVIASLFAPALGIAQERDVIVITEASAPATIQQDQLGTFDTAAYLPRKGSSKAAVSSQFGPPSVRHPPVGGGSKSQPPITRWDYDHFSVFFEYNHVIDAVRFGNPAPVAVRDGLVGGPR